MSAKSLAVTQMGKTVLRAPFVSASIEDGELKNKMVESGSQIMNTVANNHGRSFVQRFALGPSDNQILPFRIVFEGNGNILSIIVSRLQDRRDSFMQINEVMLRSVKLGTYPCQ